VSLHSCQSSSAAAAISSPLLLVVVPNVADATFAGSYATIMLVPLLVAIALASIIG